MIEFTVSMPPSVNNLFFNVKGKGRVRTGRYRSWQDENLWALKALKLGSVEGLVRVDYRLPVKNSQDIDNPLKALNDLLQSSGILENDKQIRQLWVGYDNRTDVLVKVEALYQEAS